MELTGKIKCYAVNSNKVLLMREACRSYNWNLLIFHKVCLLEYKVNIGWLLRVVCHAIKLNSNNDMQERIVRGLEAFKRDGLSKFVVKPFSLGVQNIFGWIIFFSQFKIEPDLLK